MPDPTPPPATPSPLTYRDLQRAIFLVFGLLLAWRMAGVLTTLLLFFLLAFILSAVLNPVALWLQRRRVPRLASALGLAVLFLAGVVTLTALAVPPLLEEVATFVRNVPEKQQRLLGYYHDLLERYPDLKQQLPTPAEVFQRISPGIGDLLGQVGRYTVSVAGVLVSVFLLLVLVIFTVANPAPLVTGLLAATPERLRGRVETALRRILHQLQKWATGSLLLGLVIGVMTAIGLWALGLITGKPMQYILLFSVIAGIGEMIPTLGPILSAVPPALVAFSIDPVLGLWVVALFVIIQQLENNLIVPVVMGQSLDFHPVTIIFSVLVMATLFGLFGAVLAMPVAAIVKVCWEEFYLAPRRTDTDALERVAEDIVGDPPPAAPAPGH
jgi:putative permease